MLLIIIMLPFTATNLLAQKHGHRPVHSHMLSIAYFTAVWPNSNKVVHAEKLLHIITSAASADAANKRKT